MKRSGRRDGWAPLILQAALAVAAMASRTEATIRAGDIQISGNVQTQNLFRIQDGTDTFNAFDPIQQRNTFRLQYEHQIVKPEGGFLGSGLAIPLIESADFFAYYRFVYDSIYDIAPGSTIHTQDGSPGGSISDFADAARGEVAFENTLREVFLDLQTTGPVSFRIGRQQIVWGEALNFRALDSANALDLTWHLQQEAGLFGKVGFDELRIPAWTIKMLVNLGSFGPFSNAFFEAYDIPFDFQPAEIRFNPAPFSVPIRDPFRGGLVIDLGEADGRGGLPAGNPLLRFQPCFDTTGNSAPNAAAAPDFGETATTGFCNSAGRQESRIRQGIYDRRDPADVNQFGARFGASGPFGVNFTLNYLYRRHLGADIPSATIAKAQVGAVNANPLDFLQVAPHATTDRITGETSAVTGFFRVPIEFYYPYVHVLGVSANYFEELTGSVLTAEAALTKGLPIATLDPSGNGLNRKDVLLGAVNIDRPTWIRLLNRRATWLLTAQLNFNWIPAHDRIRIDRATGLATGGDVGLPNTDLIPEQFGSLRRIDEVKQLELLSLLVATSFYRGGTVVPLLAWINDWSNAPSMEFIAAVDFLPTNDIIVTPALRIFTNFGRNVDEVFGVGRLSQNDELQLKLTYQF